MAIAMLLGVTSCAGTPLGRSGEARTVLVEGSAFFEARAPTPTGASRALSRRPIRQAIVRFVDGDGSLVGEGEIDDGGHFSVAVPATAVRVQVWAQIRREGLSLAVTPDALGRDPYRVEAPIHGGAALDLVATDEGPEAAGGAFHILDTLLRGANAVREWTGRAMPPVFVHWGRGVTTAWSYYRGERPPASGRYCLELLGGEQTRQPVTDTDEYDTSIVLHEYAHFVMDRLSTDSSAGGMHPSGHLIEPGLAWEEGRASWFSASVLGNPWYLDTVGLEPVGSLRVAHNLERGGPGPRGLGSEQGVAEILWDLSDGAGSLEDMDEDGAALGAGEVLRAMTELRSDEGAYPAISTFLRHLLGTRRVTGRQLERVLAAGGHPLSLLSDAQAAWPRELAVPGIVGAKIDGVSEPAPSGGPNRAANGFDAVHIYKIRLPRAGTLTAELIVDGSGLDADDEDLDLELRDIRSNLLISSRGEAPRERLSRPLEPGWYVLYVRDGGGGNRVGYTLQVWTAP